MEGREAALAAGEGELAEARAALAADRQAVSRERGDAAKAAREAAKERAALERRQAELEAAAKAAEDKVGAGGCWGGLAAGCEAARAGRPASVPAIGSGLCAGCAFPG